MLAAKFWCRKVFLYEIHWLLLVWSLLTSHPPSIDRVIPSRSSVRSLWNSKEEIFSLPPIFHQWMRELMSKSHYWSIMGKMKICQIYLFIHQTNKTFSTVSPLIQLLECTTVSQIIRTIMMMVMTIPTLPSVHLPQSFLYFYRKEERDNISWWWWWWWWWWWLWWWWW